jgi:hypothetical protein
MAYELRIPGQPPASFDTEAAAIAAARGCLADNPDAEPEVIDLATGKPCAPGASKEWRDELSKRVGF